METRSKRSKTVNNDTQTSKKEKYNLVELPLDVVIEILGRLPVKSVSRFLAVSKLWATSIRSRSFITSFPFGSSSQPSTLIVWCEVSAAPGEFQDWHWFSSYYSSTSFLSRMAYPFPYDGDQDQYRYHLVNGLISLGYGPKQIVCNPSTGKFIDLPKVKTRRRLVNSFFGYDSVNDQYKVLCMTEKLHGDHKDPSCHHQVFTLGVSKSWRMIDCSFDHRPSTNGVCIDSVVYYFAKTGVGMSHMSLMRFDLRSESLDRVSDLPAEIPTKGLYDTILINYKGKVAKPTKTTIYTFDVWVMDQDSDTHEWLKIITFSVEPWKDLFHHVSIKGITHKGEFILGSPHYSDEFYVFHYNPDMDSFRRITLTLSTDCYKYRPSYRGSMSLVFSEYVESVRLL